MSKLTTDVLLKESIKSILTELVNSTYDWQEYTDSEISDILEISDEQALELSKIINDNVKANNKLWSSNKIDSELQNMIIEANKYSDELIGQISSISLEYVTVLPDIDIKSNVIYILQGNPNTLNVYNNYTSAFVTVGDLNIDLTNYYTKSEVDAELAKKANADEVLKPDAIVSDLTTTSGSTTLSTAGLQTELDKKANDDEVVKKADVVTSISKTSTDNTVPTSKAVETRMSKREIIKNVDLNTFVDEGKYYIASGCTNSPIDGGYLNIMRYNDDFVCQMCARYYISTSKNMYIRTKVSGTWREWQSVCTTSVEDIPWTNITGNLLSTKVKFSNADSYASYCVKNGTCYVTIWSMTILAECGVEVLFNGLPEAAITGSSSLKTANASFGLVFTGDGGQILTNVDASCIGKNGYCTLSYPVKES